MLVARRVLPRLRRLSRLCAVRWFDMRLEVVFEALFQRHLGVIDEVVQLSRKALNLIRKCPHFIIGDADRIAVHIVA